MLSICQSPMGLFERRLSCNSRERSIEKSSEIAKFPCWRWPPDWAWPSWVGGSPAKHGNHVDTNHANTKYEITLCTGMHATPADHYPPRANFSSIAIRDGPLSIKKYCQWGSLNNPFRIFCRWLSPAASAKRHTGCWLNQDIPGPPTPVKITKTPYHRQYSL